MADDPNTPDATKTNQNAGAGSNATPGSEKSPDEKLRDRMQWRAGLVLIVVGLLGFLLTGIFSDKLPDHGGVPAASMLFLLLGIAFYFPDMLRGPDDGFSTMRVIVFITV